MKLLLLGLVLLGGCAAHMSALPPLRVQPVQAQFGLRFSHAGSSVPLQGAVQAADNEGSLGVIFPHGRTLGVCRYRVDGMECVPAGGESGGARFMLRQIGLAVYRILPALAGVAIRDSAATDWTVRWQEAEVGLEAEYRDLASQVSLEIHVTELARP